MDVWESTLVKIEGTSEANISESKPFVRVTATPGEACESLAR